MKRISTCLLICLLVGCTSSYERHFVSDLSVTAPSPSEYASRNLVFHEGEPQIVKRPMTDELKSELASQGYVLVGHSNFNSRYANPDHAADMAKKVGAQMVIVDIKPSHRETELEKETDFVPLTSSSTHTTTTPTGQTQQHTSVTHVNVEQVTYVPRTYTYYNHAAWYYAKKIQ